MKIDRVCSLLCIFLLAGAACGQDVAGSPARIRFQFSWPARDASTYSIELLTDRSGSFTGSLVEKSQLVQAAVKLKVSQATTRSVFEDAKLLKLFNVGCAAKMKGVADTGTKVLTYKGPEGSGSCTYNYTENKTVEALTTAFEGIESTLIEGRKLEFDHRFDRLALFEEMNVLTEQFKAGRAIEMGNIAETLRSIADDPEVIEKAREQAITLLKTAE